MGCDVPLRCIDRARTGNYARRLQTRPPAGEATRMEQPRSDDVIHVPASVRFPGELVPPDGFDPARLETWPRVEGRLEWVDAATLREKARWYLTQEVPVVWIVLPGEREVIVVTSTGETCHAIGERLPVRQELPGLQPQVADFFRQISPS